MSVIGIIHPGAMGASVGSAANQKGHRTIWASSGLSTESVKRASRAKLLDCITVANMVDESDVIISVCPPHAAEDVATEVVNYGFTGIFVDANAIAPERTRRIGQRLQDAGARFVDGGIIGGPAWTTEANTKLYLSGNHAESIADIFASTPLNANVISKHIGSASALKMVFAAYTKGTSALLAAILAVAEKEGVRSELEKQWGEDFTRRTHQGVIKNTAKAWRFEGEMREIAHTFQLAGYPSGFHEAAADIFALLEGFKKVPAKELSEVLATMINTN